MIEDTGWFFDTELLVLAERAGLRIHEVPVDWVDDPDSRVDILPTAVADLKGIARLSRALSDGRLPLARCGSTAGGPPADRPPRLLHQLVSFGVIGVASTLAYAALYLLVRNALSAQSSNALALLVTAIANTAANRRFTFGVRGSAGNLVHQTQGFVVFALGLAVTSGSLVLLRHYDPVAGRRVELAVLVGASVAATLLRFGLFKVWVFPRRRTSSRAAAATSAGERTVA